MKTILSPARLAKGLWWNRNWPVLEGCTPCSPACDNCFAAEYAHRFAAALPYLAGLTTAEGKWNGAVLLREDQLVLPLRTRKPTVFFVAERSDLYHPAVPDACLDKAYAVMALCPQHVFLVLTKRPERLAEYWSTARTELGLRWWKARTYRKDGSSIAATQCGIWPETGFPNVLHGTTAWDQASADCNIPLLLQVPGKRFLSAEPLLGAVNLRHIDAEASGVPWCQIDALTGRHTDMGRPCEDVQSLHWVIAGGESGPNARPSHPGWFRGLRDQCQAASVPFFFKQWGEYVGGHALEIFNGRPGWCDFHNRTVGPSWHHQFDESTVAMRAGKKAAGRLLDGKEHLELPKVVAR